MAVACLLASGCGIQMRTPAAPVTTTITASVSAPSATPREAVILPPVNVEPLELDPGQTVVTITFDDGRASNAKAAQILNAYGLRGTFFINSGNIGKPGYLSLTDLDWIATDSGNEIGGNTVRSPGPAHPQHRPDPPRDLRRPRHPYGLGLPGA